MRKNVYSLRVDKGNEKDKERKRKIDINLVLEDKIEKKTGVLLLVFFPFGEGIPIPHVSSSLFMTVA